MTGCPARSVISHARPIPRLEIKVSTVRGQALLGWRLASFAGPRFCPGPALNQALRSTLQLPAIAPEALRKQAAEIASGRALLTHVAHHSVPIRLKKTPWWS